MKPIIFSFCALSLCFLPSCNESSASTGSERPPENGAQFKKGEGLSLTEEMAHSIGLKTSEVKEQKITAHLEIMLLPVAGTNEATGWLTVSQAEKIKPGAVVEFSSQPGIKGTVKSVIHQSASALMEPEIVVTTNAPLANAGETKAAVVLPETEAAAIPRSALLSTAEGHFVYATNGKFFVRTPVKTGAMDEDHVEITEGLYAGDEVVSTPVTSLWMAELQVLRGGKACTCGH